MEPPPESADDMSAQHSQRLDETSGTAEMLHDVILDNTSASSVPPVFVHGDDGSMIYRSFRVRQAKVCETVSFPIAAPANSPRGSRRSANEVDALSDGKASGMPYIFCEMQELSYNAGQHGFEWRETTRWMFFEEMVEKPGDRWSKPHVPSLPAASVFDFRNCLIAGTIVLNLDASSFEELADMVGDILIATNQLSQGAKAEFLSILHLRHRHHFEYKQSTLDSLRRLGKSARVNLVSSRASSPNKADADIGPITVDTNVDGGNPDRVHKVNPDYRRYVPATAQAASILVGEVAALRTQLTIFIRLARPLYVGDLTEVDTPLKFLCILLGPPSHRINASTSASVSAISDGYSLQTMGRVFGALLSNPAFSRVALRAENREGLMAAFDAVVDRSTLLPAETWDPEVRLAPIAFPAVSKHSSAQLQANRQTMRILPTAEAELDSNLLRTGMLFGGFCRDVQRKLPHYIADFTEALHLECGVASVIMLLTTLTWLLVFSAMYESMTESQIGATETFFGACLCGIIFYLTSGQPLTVIGTTASLFAFERVVFAFCKMYAISYVGFHFWVIFWTLAVIFIVIMFDLSAVVCYFTRFSQEVFSSFIATVLIVEALASLNRIKAEYPLTDDNCVCARDPTLYTDENTCRVRSIQTCQHIVGCQISGNCAKPNSFVFSCLLFVLTYVLINKLKSFRSSFILPNRIRVIVGNFALPLTIIVLTIFSSCISVDVPRLHFSPRPSDGTFPTTDPDRGLVVNPGVVPAWAVFTAVLVAVPCTLLLLMDQHFAAIVVNRRENRLKHGCGYHLDLVAISGGLLVSAVFGLPIFAGVVILSYANVVSLQKTTSCKKESKIGYTPTFRIREQRVTSLIVSVAIGFCVLLSGVFSHIPMAVLHGIFFYLGVATLSGTQFWHRVKLMLVPIKYQPDYKFLRYIELIKVHVFTIFQLGLIFLLWTVTLIKPIAFIFPLTLVVIALVRRLLTFGFSRDELLRLDAVLMPLSVICRPASAGDYLVRDSEYEKPKLPTMKPMGEIVTNLRLQLTKRLDGAREKIRKLRGGDERSSRRRQEQSDIEEGMSDLEQTPHDHDDDTAEITATDDQQTTTGGGDQSGVVSGDSYQQQSPEKPPRRRVKQDAVDMADETDQVTASIASPTSSTAGVYTSATAVIAQNSQAPSSWAAPANSSPNARLIVHGTSSGVVTSVDVDEDEQYEADAEVSENVSK